MATEKRLIWADDALAAEFTIEEGGAIAYVVDSEVIRRLPTVDAISVKDLERILSTTPGLELWDYQKRGIMSAVNRLCGKEKNDG